jgi:hypothetical protein
MITSQLRTDTVADERDCRHLHCEPPPAVEGCADEILAPRHSQRSDLLCGVLTYVQGIFGRLAALPSHNRARCYLFRHVLLVSVEDAIGRPTP